MAKFKYKWGVMNSGKSQELLRVVYNYKSKNETVLVLVPDTDNRHGVGKVTTRAGGEISATAVTPGTMKNFLKEFVSFLIDKPVCILVDEVQFFTKKDIVALKGMTLKYNIPVIAYGLKTDFQNKLFEGSQACIVYAEEICEIETVCKYCNKKAIMNLRLGPDGKPARKGEQIVIGDSEYVQVCNEHWNNPE